MEWVETTAKSVEEAKDIALDQLGVDESEAEFEIINEAKSGIFGIGRTDARVRARVRPTAPRSKDQHQRKRRGRNERPTKDERPAKPAGEKPDNSDKAEKAGKSDGGNSSAPAAASASSANESTTDEAAPKAGGNNRSRNNRRRNASGRTERSVETNEGGSDMDEQVALADQGEHAKTFLIGFLGEINIPATIDISVDEEEELVHLAVEGENLGHLIGPRGTALHSLQELTRTVVQRKTGARNGRIILDISQYREKRRVALEKFTHQIADEVKANKVTRALEPMHPSDRKIVHDTVNEIDGVETTSEGEEPRRRVVIKPAGA